MGGEADKAAAVRAAERAIRPWSAIVGLGERRGAWRVSVACFDCTWLKNDLVHLYRM